MRSAERGGRWESFTGLLSSPTVSLETSVLFGVLKGVGRDGVCGQVWARVPERALGVWLWRGVMAAGGRQSGLEGFIIFVFSKTVILQSPEICRYVAEMVQQCSMALVSTMLQNSRSEERPCRERVSSPV